MFYSMVDSAWSYEANEYNVCYRFCKKNPGNEFYSSMLEEHESKMTQYAQYLIRMTPEDRAAIDTILAKYKI